MNKIAVSLATRRVDASAHIRHVVAANIPDPRNVVAISVPARRGPIGPQGDRGPPGAISTDQILLLDGGNF